MKSSAMFGAFCAAILLTTAEAAATPVLVAGDEPTVARYVAAAGESDRLFTATNELEHLTVDASVESVPAGVFKGLGALKTVCFEKDVTVGAGAFAECPALTLVDLLQGHFMKYGEGAFAGVTNLTVHYYYIPIKPVARKTLEPGDGKPFAHVIYAGDDCHGHRRLFLADGFLWADDPDGATALVSLAEDGRVIVPPEFRGKATVGVGRHLLPRLETRYRLLALPAGVTKADLFPGAPKVDILFGQCRTDCFGLTPCIDAKTRVYGTKPDPRTGALVNVFASPAYVKRLPSSTDPVEFLKRLEEEHTEDDK